MLAAKNSAWQQRIRLVKESFALKDAQKALEQIASIESGMQEAEDTLKEFEETAYLQMTNCYVEFDQVAGLGSTVAAHTKKGRSIIDRVSMSPGSTVDDMGHGNRTLRFVFFCIAIFCVIAVAAGIMHLQKLMETKAKKMK
jgi:hypothetical protein